MASKYDIPEHAWWEEASPGEDPRSKAVAERLFCTVKDIIHRQTSICEGNLRHAREYLGYTPSSMSYAAADSIVRERTEATKNLVRSVCDTATALIAKSRPKPTIVTDGAEFSVQERAKQLDRFLVGAYSRMDMYQVAQDAFRDSCIFGTGAWKLIPRPGKAKVDAERVIVDDLVVDELECRTSPKPRHWYEVMRLRADAACRKWPDHREAIMAARGSTDMSYANGRRLRQDEVLIIEAYHLPDEEGQEGVRLLAVEGEVLDRQTWCHAWAPYVILHWSPPVTGFYGDGVSYRLLGRQMRINYLYRWIQRCQDLIAVPRVWLDAANGPIRVQLSNEIGEVVSVRGKPEFQTPQAVSAEIYSWLDALEKGGYEDEGISMASAANRLPPGLESAPAQREYSFKEGQRFAPVSQRYENAVAQETAYKTLALFKDLAEAGDEPKETWANRRLFDVIEWEDVDMEDTRYLIRVEASSIESLNPASRLQAAIELSQTGWVSPSEGRRLLGHPDIMRADDLGTSAVEDAEDILEQLLRGEAVAIDAYSDLEEVYNKVVAGYRRAKTTRAPRKVLDHLRNYLRALDEAMAPPPGMGPEAGMGAPPQIDPMTGQPMAPTPGISLAAAQGLGVPFSQAGTSREGV